MSNHVHLIANHSKGQLSDTIPVRAMIVEHPEDYLYSSARNYAGLSGFLDVILLDSKLIAY